MSIHNKQSVMSIRCKKRKMTSDAQSLSTSKTDAATDNQPNKIFKTTPMLTEDTKQSKSLFHSLEGDVVFSSVSLTALQQILNLTDKTIFFHFHNDSVDIVQHSQNLCIHLNTRFFMREFRRRTDGDGGDDAASNPFRWIAKFGAEGIRDSIKKLAKRQNYQKLYFSWSRVTATTAAVTTATDSATAASVVGSADEWRLMISSERVDTSAAFGRFSQMSEVHIKSIPWNDHDKHMLSAIQQQPTPLNKFDSSVSMRTENLKNIISNPHGSGKLFNMRASMKTNTIEFSSESKNGGWCDTVHCANQMSTDFHLALDLKQVRMVLKKFSISPVIYFTFMSPAAVKDVEDVSTLATDDNNTVRRVRARTCQVMMKLDYDPRFVDMGNPRSEESYITLQLNRYE